MNLEKEEVMEQEKLTLQSICGGAVEEVFQRELEAILANIGDVNRDPEAKRKLTLEFTFEPFDDRSGAKVTFLCNSKMVPMEAAKGTLFLQRRGISMVAFPHDPKQSRLFSQADPTVS